MHVCVCEVCARACTKQSELNKWSTPDEERVPVCACVCVLVCACVCARVYLRMCAQLPDPARLAPDLTWHLHGLCHLLPIEGDVGAALAESPESLVERDRLVDGVQHGVGGPELLSLPLPVQNGT